MNTLNSLSAGSNSGTSMISHRTMRRPGPEPQHDSWSFGKARSEMFFRQLKQRLAPHTGRISNSCGQKAVRSNHSNRFWTNGMCSKLARLSRLGIQPFLLASFAKNP